MQEKSKKSQGREAKVVGEGVILEEAIVRCGSREQLHAAVSRGAVKILRAGGLDLFQFPSHQNSMTERVSTEVESTATSGSNPDIHAAMRSQGLTSVAMEVPDLPRALSGGGAPPLGLPSASPTPTMGLPPLTCGNSLPELALIGALEPVDDGLTKEMADELQVKVKKAEVHPYN